MRQLMILLCLLALPSWAHEVRPAYLELRETGAGTFEVLWKVPMRGELRLGIEPALPEGIRNLTPRICKASNNAAVCTWNIESDANLRGQTLGIAGLEKTCMDSSSFASTLFDIAKGRLPTCIRSLS